MKKIIVHHEAEVELWQAVNYYESKRLGLGLEFEKETSRAGTHPSSSSRLAAEKLRY